MNPLDSTLPDLVLTTDGSERWRRSVRSNEVASIDVSSDLLGENLWPFPGGIDDERVLDGSEVRAAVENALASGGWDAGRIGAASESALDRWDILHQNVFLVVERMLEVGWK